MTVTFRRAKSADGPSTARIDGLYVHTEMRGKAVGKRLLDLAKENRDWITGWAYKLNAEARRFYRREGIVEISRETEHHKDEISLVDNEHRWERPSISK